MERLRTAILLASLGAAAQAGASGEGGGSAPAGGWLEGLSQPSTDPAAVDPDAPELLNDVPRASPSGFYGRISGMIVEQQEEVEIFAGGSAGAYSFDRGVGVTAALGRRLEQIPISIEIEYAYRNVSDDDIPTGFSYRGPILATGDLDLHTLTANLLLDLPDLLGPVGVYAGAGIGFARGHFETRSQFRDSNIDVSGDGLFVQAMAGLTVSITRSVQLYGGLRWSDAGRIENESASVRAEMVAAEAGLRIFF
ncbi:MAG: outer membrane protein [Phycisphaerales bacterium JB039]